MINIIFNWCGLSRDGLSTPGIQMWCSDSLSVYNSWCTGMLYLVATALYTLNGITPAGANSACLSVASNGSLPQS
jgi:hypothetical protein